MQSFRIARLAFRAPTKLNSTPAQYRGYAEVAIDKIRLSLSLPHKSLYKSQNVRQVNIPAESGEMGILAKHVPSIEQLKPGLVEVIEDNGESKLFFLAGGFAVVQPDSQLCINAVEGFPLSELSMEKARTHLTELQKKASETSADEESNVRTNIALEVISSLIASQK
ncbi:unnamed protein product [Blumeria hordei]|uniref:ATP synthase subunit delta, mitochondrial n=2 Tax=Blumeria hordei TaxID=2867405 RepID=A0A383UMJ0_BLUHO|nr:ATP synthase delta chain, mitochondrial precursor [Blumeria hordei DH14]SZF01523.1 unnamed protein product [Blumeria hordei]